MVTSAAATEGPALYVGVLPLNTFKRLCTSGALCQTSPNMLLDYFFCVWIAILMFEGMFVPLDRFSTFPQQKLDLAPSSQDPEVLFQRRVVFAMLVNNCPLFLGKCFRLDIPFADQRCGGSIDV